MDVEFLYNPTCGHCRHGLATVEEALADEPDVDLEVVDLAREPEAAEEYDLRCCPGVVVDGTLAFLGVPSEAELRRRVHAAGSPGGVGEPRFARRYENSTPVDRRGEAEAA